MNNKGWIGIIIILILLVGVGLFFYFVLIPLFETLGAKLSGSVVGVINKTEEIVK